MSAQDSPSLTTACSAQSERDVLRWSGRDTGWLSNLFGTAVGAGVLYLPINAGRVGFIPLVVIALLAGPMIWFAHRNLTRFCLVAERPDADITSTMNDRFGRRWGSLLTLAYFLSIYPILLLYAIGLTNVTEQFFRYQLEWPAPHRSVIGFVLLAVLVVVINKGERWVLSAVESLVMPLVVILIGISLYLIPQWHLDHLFLMPAPAELAMSAFVIIPMLIFSFNHSPACSAFAQAYRMVCRDTALCARKTDRILAVNAGSLLLVVMLFVFSCVLSLTPAEIQVALQENVPVLSVFASREGAGFFALIASVIAFLAITSSFFGVYMGSIEGVGGLFTLLAKRVTSIPVHSDASTRIAKVLIFLSCWLAACLNLSVIGVIEGLLAPLLAVILFFMPVYGYYTIPELKHYRNPVFDVFTVASGVIAISGFIVSKWF